MNLKILSTIITYGFDPKICNARFHQIEQNDLQILGFSSKMKLIKNEFSSNPIIFEKK